MAVSRGKIESLAGEKTIVAGSFGLELPSRSEAGDTRAYYEWPIASGSNIVVEAGDDYPGEDGNVLDFEAINTGNATATMTITFGANPMVITHATAGDSVNGLTVNLVPGCVAGAEVATEDAAGNLYVTYQGGVSTLTQVAAAVDGHVNWVSASVNVAVDTLILIGTLAGGTAKTYAAEAGTATTLYYTHNDTTIAQAAAAINAVSSGNQLVTARVIDGTAPATKVVNGDVSGAATLASGAYVSNVSGDGFSVQGIGTGLYRIQLEDDIGSSAIVDATLQQAAIGVNDDRSCVLAAYDSTNHRVDIQITDNSDAGAKAGQITPAANERINFVIESNKGGDRSDWPVQSPNRGGYTEVTGSFATLNGNGAIISVLGTGFTVDDKAAASTYVITMDDYHASCIEMGGKLQLNAADNWDVQGVSYVAATRKLTLKVIDGTTQAAAADPADHANNRITFRAVFPKTSVITSPVKVLGRDRLMEVVGSFATHNGAGTVENPRGGNFAVAKGAAGIYTVTMDQYYPELVSITGKLQQPAAAPTGYEVVPISYTAATRALVLHTVNLAAGAAADIDPADDADSRVNFRALFRL